MRNNRRAKSHRPQLETLEQRQLLAADLRIAEINYHPHAAFEQFGEREADADDFEFAEVANLGDAAVNLAGYEIDGGIRFRFSSQWLDPGERLVVTRDLKDFRSRYGESVAIALGNDGDDGKEGEYEGSLNNSGETLVLKDASGRTVQSFSYFDAGEWPKLADGQGSSLEAVNAQGDLNDPKNWRASSEYGGSPGTEGHGWLGDVVINELLTHTDLPQIDTIELANRTDQQIDLTGWYLTDTAEDIFRFEFSGPSARIGAENYRVYDEEQLGFSFRGQEADDVFLIEADAAGRPLRFADVVSFSATQNGITLGRWDDGVGELFPMEFITFEDENDGPLIGDVVISELHYHPATPTFDVGLTENEMEFLEIVNQSEEIQDISFWQFRESVDFEFPEETEIAPGETIVVVGFDPERSEAKADAFRAAYGFSTNVQLLGPYSDAGDPNPDQLDDNGERVILERPEDIQQLGLGYVLVDRVIYEDAGEWPTEADGQGASLRRADLNGYGDFASTWVASPPSPGILGIRGDVTGDNKVDADDIDVLCDAANLGIDAPLFDLNQDGSVSFVDVQYLVSEILNTSLGDANLDGRFDSEDFVEVFIAGQYDDGVASNSGWATGDWNCDGEFDSEDIVAAFIAGGYEEPPAAVFEIGSMAAIARSDVDAAAQEPTTVDAQRVESTTHVRANPLVPQAADLIFADDENRWTNCESSSSSSAAEADSLETPISTL